MKYLLLFILSISSIAQSSAISSNLVLRCDSLRLTDGRTVAVQILGQTEDHIIIAHCGDKTMKERPLLKRFVEAVIVNGRVIQEPAKYLKSKERRQKSNWKDIKNRAKLASGGTAIYLLFKYRDAIIRGIWTGFVRLFLFKSC